MTCKYIVSLLYFEALAKHSLSLSLSAGAYLAFEPDHCGGTAISSVYRECLPTRAAAASLMKQLCTQRAITTAALTPVTRSVKPAPSTIPKFFRNSSESIVYFRHTPKVKPIFVLYVLMQSIQLLCPPSVQAEILNIAFPLMRQVSTSRSL